MHPAHLLLKNNLSFLVKKRPFGLLEGLVSQRRAAIGQCFAFCPKDWGSMSTDASTASSSAVVDIEELHQTSLLQGSTTYSDPSTGFTVFTELAHLQRGHCCGSKCRHCPYGWKNVSSGARRQSKVESGDATAIQELLTQIHEQKRTAKLEKKKEQQSEGPPTTNDDISENANVSIHKNQKTGGRLGGALTSKNVPYTRGGDQGTSQLLTGERRSKADDAFEAMGTVDELCSVVGVIYSHLKQEVTIMQQQQKQHNTNMKNDDEEQLQTTVEDLDEWLLDIMSRLFDIGSHLAKPKRLKKDDDSSSSNDEISAKFVPDGIGGGFHAHHVTELEEAIDLMTEDLPELRSFLLPASPSLTVAQCHVARTVCRRAERRVIPLVQLGICDPNALAYLNRLSDYCFTAARWIHRHIAQQPHDVEYKRPHRGAKQRHRITAKSAKK